jgi:hypothetical protein
MLDSISKYAFLSKVYKNKFWSSVDAQAPSLAPIRPVPGPGSEKIFYTL